jgi:hypothetical protein
MKKLVFNLVDEVFDVGDALLVRCGGREEPIALADIKNVNYFPYMSPPRSTCRCGGRPCSTWSTALTPRVRALQRGKPRSPGFSRLAS